MKNCVNKTLKILSGSIVALSAPSIFATTSCSKGDAIEFANYESYMSENLMNDLQSHYNIHFPNYTVAEMIPAKFEKFYDCAIPCGYELMALLRNDWLEKIDWSKFGVKDMSGKAVTDVKAVITINEADSDGEFVVKAGKKKFMRVVLK